MAGKAKSTEALKMIETLHRDTGADLRGAGMP